MNIEELKAKYGVAPSASSESKPKPKSEYWPEFSDGTGHAAHAVEIPPYQNCCIQFMQSTPMTPHISSKVYLASKHGTS